VTCEGLPALFHFTISGNKQVSDLKQTLPLSGNPLDLTVLKSGHDTALIIVSLDQIHEPGSTTLRRQGGVSCYSLTHPTVKLTKLQDVPHRLQVFSPDSSGVWSANSELDKVFASLDRQVQEDTPLGAQTEVADVLSSGTQNAIQDILYGIENLRKRAGPEDF
jgi:tRNA (guanine-N(7)-)-methyltransferase subunit TRM82